ncbi:serine/threonine protein kinase [Thermogemmata fonticola]|uniref:non-specific serine/threonine protein kinase n=1 Tax=Thermogemmata fonticola TaxID=2755323 RepID=A0A7V9ACX1_9BACT|nr:serine/threonine-protein kinase [Thermogemmata fonticola]MBA2227751.1 serine/threonine protein kinase [Thermogemmata fonticola]
MIGRIFLGRYEARRLLGEGGMGRVYLARQVDTGRDVVVKVMHEQIAHDPKFRDRFEREMELMRRFRHPGAVQLYEADLNNPTGPCLVMEYVKGVNLETLLARSGRMSPARVGRIIGELCEVLQAAHDENIIHRDLKPANLMIIDPDTPRERVKVMDFGLAKLLDKEDLIKKVTDTNVDFAVGTPGYICPEQVRGEEMDHRGDIYSVGVIMYELLTGRLPFVGGSSMDILLAHATEPPPRFAEIGLKGVVPPEIEELVLQCLAKDPADRPQQARDLAERYDTALVRWESQQEERLARQRPQPGSSHLLPVSPSTPTPPPRSSTAEGSDALTFQMEAWLPERIALMKLRGFVYDAGGEVLDSQPGCVVVRLGGKRTGLSWFGLARRATGPLDVELHLTHAHPQEPNRLTVQVVFRPSHPSLLDDPQWQKRCSDVFVQLRSYLMGRVTS